MSSQGARDRAAYCRQQAASLREKTKTALNVNNERAFLEVAEFWDGIAASLETECQGDRRSRRCAASTAH